jgi:hypothetical protein
MMRFHFSLVAGGRLRPVDERVTEYPPFIVFGVGEFAVELMHALLHLSTSLQGAHVPFLSVRIVTMTPSKKFLRDHRSLPLSGFGSRSSSAARRPSDD